MVRLVAFSINALGAGILAIAFLMGLADGQVRGEDVFPAILLFSYLGLNLAALADWGRRDNWLSSFLRRKRLEEQIRITKLEGQLDSERRAA